MRFSLLSAITVALAADATVASSWFSKAAYNKWHETELERWLSDNNVPYPTPADRKDLQNLVKDNWNDKVVAPYSSWDTNQLQSYLSSKGQETKDSAAANKDSLLASVKKYWYETEDQASDAYGSVKDWIFDSWTDSQLKSFADKHGIPVPQPRARDSLLKVVRENYQSAANKVGETAAYPGNWLYESWSDSDIKAWLDARGYDVPQPSTRDALIASVRRNSRLASLNSQSYASSISSSAAAATQSLSDALLNSWSDSQFKEFFDKNNIKVPQGSKRNELIALARKHRASLTGDNVADKASSAYGAATSSAGNQYAQATNAGSNVVQEYVDWFKYQFGLFDQKAKASYSSASSVAAASASSASSVASKSSSSLSSVASQSSSSVSSVGSKSSSSASKSGYSNASKAAQKAADAATESATSGKNRVAEAAQKATDYVKEEL